MTDTVGDYFSESTLTETIAPIPNLTLGAPAARFDNPH